MPVVRKHRLLCYELPDAIMLKSCSAWGLVGCPIVLQVVGQVWGVNCWRQFQVCLVCQRKAGGDTGGGGGGYSC